MSAGRMDGLAVSLGVLTTAQADIGILQVAMNVFFIPTINLIQP